VANTTTANYGWQMPDPGGSANTWGNTLNATTQAIDQQVFTNAGLLSGYLPLTGGTISGNFSVQGTATLGNGNLTIDASGNLSTNNNITVNGTVQSGTVNSTGNISASGTATAGGSVTGGSITSNGATNFFHSTYTDFCTNINTSNASRWFQFATGWSIQAVVNSSAYYFYIGGNTVQTLDYAGNLVIYGQGYKPGGGSWGASSDERVKRNVEPYRQGLKELSRLEPISYAYNGKGGTQDDGQRYVGLVAQAAQKVMPSLVREMPGEFEGKIAGQLATDTSELVFALVNAVKELSIEIAALKAKMP
jgi:trimeric autotransporter adhesin